MCACPLEIQPLVLLLQLAAKSSTVIQQHQHLHVQQLDEATNRCEETNTPPTTQGQNQNTTTNNTGILNTHLTGMSYCGTECTLPAVGYGVLNASNTYTQGACTLHRQIYALWNKELIHGNTYSDILSAIIVQGQQQHVYSTTQHNRSQDAGQHSSSIYPPYSKARWRAVLCAFPLLVFLVTCCCKEGQL